MSTDIVEHVEQKFRSGNTIPVDRAYLSADEWAQLKAEIVRLRGEVFRIAGGDTECCPNPTTENALDCLRDLRQCYDESIAPAEAKWGIAGLDVHLCDCGPGCERIVCNGCGNELGKLPQPAGGEAVVWQSMATAPRDGTVIHLRWGHDGISPGWWSAPVSPIQNEDGTWPTMSGYPWAFVDKNNGRAFVNHARDNAYGPTHWAPYNTNPAGDALGAVRELAGKWPQDRHPDPHSDQWTLGYLRAKRECSQELTAALRPSAGEGLDSLDEGG